MADAVVAGGGGGALLSSSFTTFASIDCPIIAGQKDAGSLRNVMHDFGI